MCHRGKGFRCPTLFSPDAPPSHAHNPSPQVTEVISFICSGEYVYLHCSDGNGRSGMVAACVLGLVHGLGATEALALLARSRACRRGAGGASPETHEQRMAVHALLGEAALRSRVAGAMGDGAAALAARRALARHSDGRGALRAATLTTAAAKVRGIVTLRRGAAGLLVLRRAAAALAAGGSAVGAVVSGALRRADGAPALDKVGGWFLTPEEWDAVWEAAGGGGSDSVALRALFGVLRGPLPEAREAAVRDAWVRLVGRADGAAGLTAPLIAARSAAASAATPAMSVADRAAAAVAAPSVALAKLSAVFAPAGHPDVRVARRKEEDVLAEFMDLFCVRTRSGSSVTWEECVRARLFCVCFFARRAIFLFNPHPFSPRFLEFYWDISYGTPDDANFCAVMSGCWPAAPVALPGAYGAAGGGGTRNNPSITAAPGGVRVEPGGGGGGGGGASLLFPGGSGGARGGGAVAALRAHLSRVSDLAAAHLGFTLRVADGDGDGFVDEAGLAAALRATVLACATGSGSEGAVAAAPVVARSSRAGFALLPASGLAHPLLLSAGDVGYV